jgi:hypothetical protein
MCKSIRFRASHFRALCREGLWGALATSIYSVVGAYSLIKLEFWQPKNPDQYGVREMIPHLTLAWWLFGLFVIIALWIFEASFRTTQKLRDQLAIYDKQTPLEIIFDPENPNKRFWSLEPMKDDGGKQIPGQYWEYRASIKNKSSIKSVRNVRVTVESIGAFPTRPEQSHFDIDKKTHTDLSPLEDRLAVIRCWHHPAIVQGMAYGRDVYGPIKMTVNADDVSPTMAIFGFDPERTPMVWEVTADATTSTP